MAYETLPCKLSNGILSIYGSSSIQGMVANNNMVFGIVNQAYYSPVIDLIGQSVMFKKEDATPIVFGAFQYYLLPEQKVILIEDIPT